MSKNNDKLDPLRLVVVNNDKSDAEIIVRNIERLGEQADTIIATTWQRLLKKLESKIQDENCIWDGVVLDIMYESPQDFGGLDLWRALGEKGLCGALGDLMTLSKLPFKDQERISQFFEDLGSPPLVMSGATLSSKQREDLKLFIEGIRERMRKKRRG